LKAIVVLDEAWKIASDERSDAVMIVREGRKYQFGLIVASQNPTDINEAIFSNVGTTFILRIKFEKFLNYLQGSMNFSDFMRREISKFGVGQAAIEMSFQTSVQFPEVFLINRVVGEVPLDVYTVTLSEILNPEEMADQNVQKEYYFEKIDLNGKLIENNVSASTIDVLFREMDKKNRFVDVRAFAQILLQQQIGKQDVVSVLRGMGLTDSIITRIFTYL
jgi:hypothetical protein